MKKPTQVEYLRAISANAADAFQALEDVVVRGRLVTKQAIDKILASHQRSIAMK